jgi:hypothetical protein
MDSIQALDSVPIFITNEFEMVEMSSISSNACAIIGAAPSANRTLAVEFMTTKLVILWTTGRIFRILLSKSPAF